MSPCERALEDYDRLFELAGGPGCLDPGATIQKDNTLYQETRYSPSYHDVLHWRQARRVYERWLEESEWGRLFSRCRAEGALAREERA